MKIIPREERSFRCCQECKFFEFIEWIDESIGISNGNCTQFDKKVANHWESNCELHSELQHCCDCCYFSDLFDWKESDDEEDTDSTWCFVHGYDPDYFEHCCSAFKLKE